MQALIGDLLAYSRVATRRETPRTVDLAEIVTSVLSDLEARIDESGAQVSVANLPSIEADPRQMQQLFQNIIGNALKFHRTGVTPEVAIRASGIGSASVALEISDNGVGFDDAYAERIFMPFQRLHGRSEYEGTGMGLAICRRIVERHGGEVSVKSRQGEGTTFLVRLPRRQPAGGRA